MNVRVEAGVLTAKAELVSVQATVELLSNVLVLAPVVTRFTLTPVISIGGNSISSITPEFFNKGVKAAVML